MQKPKAIVGVRKKVQVVLKMQTMDYSDFQTMGTAANVNLRESLPVPVLEHPICESEIIHARTKHTMLQS